MIKAVLFDLDGLLIDSEIVAYNTIERIANSYGKSVSNSDYTSNYLGRTVAKSMEYMAESLNLPTTHQELHEKYLIEEEKNTQAGIPLKPYAEQILKNLKEQGIKTIVASSSSRERAKILLEKNGVLKYFDDLIFGYEVQRGKPYPDIFLKACDKLEVEPCEAVVLEDSEAGIDAAFSAKIPVICIPDMKHPDPEHAKKCLKIVKTLKEAEEVIIDN